MRSDLEYNTRMSFHCLLKTTNMSFSRTLLFSSPLRSSLSTVKPSLVRHYAKQLTAAEKQKDLQDKQIRLAEKAGRMKQNIGVVSNPSRI